MLKVWLMNSLFQGAHLKEMCGEDVEDEQPVVGSLSKGKFENEPKRSSFNDVQIVTGEESENSSPKESLLVGTPHSSSFLGAASLENSKIILSAIGIWIEL